MADIMTAVAAFFTGLVDVLIGLLLPASGSITPLQTVMWAGLILGFLTFIIGIVRSLAGRGG